MSEQHFTPGPWGIEQTPAANWIGPMRRKPSRKISEIICHTERECLCDSSRIRNDANAKLIASAPAMLEACKAALSVLDKMMGDSDLDSDESPEMNACRKLAAAIDAATYKSA